MNKHLAARIWLADGRAQELPKEISDAFDDYLNALPWAGTTSLDWSRWSPSCAVNLVGMTPLQVYDWVQSTRIGAHSYVAIWYSRDDGGIVVPLQEGVIALDELYRDAPGLRFAFGADVSVGGILPVYTDMLQYGHGDLLVAAI